MTLLILLALNLNLPALSTEKIHYSTSMTQGQVFHASFRSNLPKENKTKLLFLERTVPCYHSSPYLWDCFAAIPANAQTGEVEPKVIFNNEMSYPIKTKIAPFRFPSYPLRLTKEKKSLYKKKGRDKEVKIIRKALRTETPTKRWTENFVNPVKGSVESDYGEKRIIDGKPSRGYHRGVDFGAPMGTPIRSTNNGIVILSGRFIQEGNMVMIDHGQGIISAYLHLSKISVQNGQNVKIGQIIGTVGSTGVSNSPHLHFGTYIHGIPVDPLYWLKNSHRFIRN